VAIAYRAIQNGFEARFTTADELIRDLSKAAARGRLEEAIEPYVHPHALVIDELGTKATRPTPQTCFTASSTTATSSGRVPDPTG
jgi:DNA replication protein DnaC